MRKVGIVAVSASVPRPRVTLRVFSVAKNEFTYTGTTGPFRAFGGGWHTLTFTENEVAGHEDEVAWHDIVLRKAY